MAEPAGSPRPAEIVGKALGVVPTDDSWADLLTPEDVARIKAKAELAGRSDEATDAYRIDPDDVYALVCRLERAERNIGRTADV